MTTIRFPTGVTARAVHAAPDVGGEQLLAALGLPPPRATVVLNGSANHLDLELVGLLGGNGLAGILAELGLTTVTGGTDAGVFTILGQAMDGCSAPLVGVVPRGLVTWPGGPPVADGVPLEPHHSHFVLVDGDRWGDETPALLALAGALGRQAPSVAVICGGGPVTRTEAEGHLAAGRPLVVVAGSGRYADELARDPGPAIVVELSVGADALVAAVLGALKLA